MKNKISLKKILNSKQLKYGSNSILLIIAVIAIAVLINVIVGIPDLKWDLTTNGIYSLDDITKNTLNALTEDVTIIGLFDDAKVSVGSDYGEVKELLTLYAKYPHVKVEYIDPEKNPGIIKELDPEGALSLANDDFIVKSTVNGVEKKKRLEYYDLFKTETDTSTFNEYKVGSNAEQGLTGAIKFVTAEKTPAVYFTEGHSELSVTNDYATIKTYLEKNNYSVNTINLLTANEIPADAEILVIASPKNDLTTKEADLLLKYLKNGGKAVFLFDYLSNGNDFS
ncbi:MAG: GldG family protein, partial [Clostridiales bacterium]|nr:GldG family protein [Clostridiales bacterium]